MGEMNRASIVTVGILITVVGLFVSGGELFPQPATLGDLLAGIVFGIMGSSSAVVTGLVLLFAPSR